MSAIQHTSDLRQAGTAAKRVHDHKSKWRNGCRSRTPGRDGAIPPLRPKYPFTSFERDEHAINAQRNYNLTRVDFNRDVREALKEGTSDSSAVEDNDLPVVEPSQQDGPIPMYEVSGQTMLNDMIDKAVERFEVKETEKLVKEYEFITRESELSIGYLADEDEFEMVDHVKL